MTAVVNPNTINITDANVVAQGVTDFKVLVGTASGGPYTTSSAKVNVSAMTQNAGVYSCPFSALTFSPALSSFTTYFAVAEAENAQGASGGSPEASFSLASAPSAPTSFSLA